MYAFPWGKKTSRELARMLLTMYSLLFYSIVAMCNLLQHYVNTTDKRLQEIIVKGERIFQQGEGIVITCPFYMTDSSATVYRMLFFLACYVYPDTVY